MTKQSWTGLSMTNYGSFHGCNVPAHASEELDVSGLETQLEKSPRTDFYSMGPRQYRGGL